MTGAGVAGGGDCNPAGYKLAFLIVAVVVLVCGLWPSAAAEVKTGLSGLINLPGQAARRLGWSGAKDPGQAPIRPA